MGRHMLKGQHGSRRTAAWRLWPFLKSLSLNPDAPLILVGF